MAVDAQQEVADFVSHHRAEQHAQWHLAAIGQFREPMVIQALRLLPPDAADPVNVMEVPPAWWAGALDISPDGKWFIYVQSDRVESDIMILENFE